MPRANKESTGIPVKLSATQRKLLERAVEDGSAALCGRGQFMTGESLVRRGLARWRDMRWRIAPTADGEAAVSRPAETDGDDR